jgi:hypothetical protein
MMNARLFSEQAKYRKEVWITEPGDRPLIAQFAANDAQVLLKAAKFIEDECDAIGKSFPVYDSVWIQPILTNSFCQKRYKFGMSSTHC